MGLMEHKKRLHEEKVTFAGSLKLEFVTLVNLIVGSVIVKTENSKQAKFRNIGSQGNLCIGNENICENCRNP
jgi:hypothetical protein